MEMQEIIKNVIDAFDDAGDDSMKVTRTYSGRGMYGRKCVGIVTDDVSEALQWVVEFIEGELHGDDEYTVADVFREFQFAIDSMGLSQIIYFPEIDLSEEE